MSPVVLDGFLTAVLITPGGIEDYRWQAELWLSLSDGEIDPRGMKAMADAAEAALEALRKRMDPYVTVSMSTGMCDYRPAFLSSSGEPSIEMIDLWHDGFWQAANLEYPVWDELWESADYKHFVAFLRMSRALHIDGGLMLERRDVFESVINDLPAVVLGFREHTLKAARDSKRRSGRKLGRNDACPCGSGQKYKRCCLDG